MENKLQKQLDILFYDTDFNFEGNPSIAVIGAGVAGLSTALSLHKAGAKVTIISAQESTEHNQANLDKGTYPITSQVAGALWEYPPAVCGAHNDADSEENAKAWTVSTLRALQKVVRQPELFPDVGVHMYPSGFYYKQKIVPPEIEEGEAYPTMSKMLNIAKNPYISGFIYNGDDDKLLKMYRDITPPFIIDKDIVDGFQHDAALIDTDVWMGFLRSLTEQCGIPVIQRAVEDFYAEKDDISKAVEDQGRGTPVSFVICTGVNSNYVAKDKGVYPRRGAVYRFPHTKGGPGGDPLPEVANIPHLDLLKNHAFCMPVSELNDNLTEPSIPENEPGDPSHFAFIVPRGDHSIVVGGFSEAIGADEANDSFNYYKESNRMDGPYTRVDIDKKYYAERVQEMTEKAVSFLQPVADLINVHKAKGLHNYLYTGLRPFRVGGCRLELEEGTNIVHNYGHGGSGVSWSIGCAVESTHYVRKLLNGHYKSKPKDKQIQQLLQNNCREYVYTPLKKIQTVGDLYHQEKLNKTHRQTP